MKFGKYVKWLQIQLRSFVGSLASTLLSLLFAVGFAVCSTFNLKMQFSFVFSVYVSVAYSARYRIPPLDIVVMADWRINTAGKAAQISEEFYEAVNRTVV